MDRLISEQAVLDAIYMWIIHDGSNYVSIKKKIKAIPSAEPKTGHWIEEDIFDGDVAYRCSECNELFWIESGTPKDNEYNFCPKCGKRLVEPQEISDRNLKLWHDIYEEEKRRTERSEE